MKKNFFVLFASLFFSLSAQGQVAFDLPGQFLLDIGFSHWGSHPNSLKINLLESRTANIYYLYDLPLFGEKFTFNPGLGIGTDGYVFDSHATLAYTPQGLDIIPENSIANARSVKKSKLAANYVDLPIEFRFRTNPGRNSFRLGLGGKVGMLFSSQTKLKYEDNFGNNRRIKDRGDLYVERFRYGLTGRIGFSSFNFFAYYALNQVFESQAFDVLENNPRTFTFGLTIQGL